jgi:probable HAF family extracellular repeat protein
MHDLGTLGGRRSIAFDINDAQQIVGCSETAAGDDRAFLSDEGRLTDLGTLGGAHSYAYGINGAGVIIGRSYLESGERTHAFLYEAGTMIDLNSLIDPHSGWELFEARAINGRGQITGWGMCNGSVGAFLLTPCCFANAHDKSP